MVAVPTKHKFSVDSLLLMEQVGIFSSDQRVELLQGDIIDMSPINPPHANCVRKLLRLFDQHLPSQKYVIDSQNPLQLSNESLLQPDLVVLPYHDALLRAGHLQGSDAALVVEVSDSTYQYDRKVKYYAYAKGDIPEYWIIHLKKSHIEVYTTPTDGEYSQKNVYDRPFTSSLGFIVNPIDLTSFNL